tara:strand:- start:1966 stop:3129 length:1164 start_codon:yes stop_codon:yes gene_type:complete
MAEFKVKAVDFEEKSTQEIEQELVDKHAQENGLAEEQVKVETTVDAAGNVVDSTTTKVDADGNEKKEEEKSEAPAETPSLNDDSVLSFIKEKFGKEIDSLDNIFETKEAPELPEDVAAYWNFKKETGRSINDFVALNRDFDAMEPNNLLREYYKAMNPDLDGDDIDFELDSLFGYDEEYDDEKEVRRIKIAKKKELVKAKEYFEKQKEQFKMPLESRAEGSSGAESEDYLAYKKMVEESKGSQAENEKRRKFFEDETNKVFGNNFEGFGFEIEDKKLVYKPAEADKLKSAQSDINNFITSHLDDKGYIKDASAYHRSIAVATNPEAFAKFFYEQGKADAVGDYSKESKNIDMNVRSAPESLSKGGFKVTAISTDYGNRLRIKSPKNK